MSMYEIIQELNAENGSNYKMDVLKKYSDNEELKRVLKMTYDKATFTYGISMKNVAIQEAHLGTMTLSSALDHLENDLSTRNVTGNAAIELLEMILSKVSMNNAFIIEKIIKRDLRINMGRSNINKVFKGLIVKPVYMRCGIYNEKTASKINPQGAFVQLKADGTYREFVIENGEISCNSRSGEQYEYPRIYAEMIDGKYPDGHYFGELTVMEDGKVLDRSTGNGLINSSEPPHDNIKLDLWDYVTREEYSGAVNKVKGTRTYENRLSDLIKIVSFNTLASAVNRISVIESYQVDSIAEALSLTSIWMNQGFEGAILKDKDSIFRDGTNPQQLKLKLEIDAEVRVTGFIEGTPGTKREATFGAIAFETDDGKVKGQTSGFTDAQLEDFNSRREELIGKIMTVQFNDITKGRNNDYYALSHPRFMEFRDDRDDTDTLERIEEAKVMAMTLS